MFGSEVSVFQYVHCFCFESVNMRYWHILLDLMCKVFKQRAWGNIYIWLHSFTLLQVQNLVRENGELRSIIQHAGLSLPHLSFSSLCSSPLPNGHEAETEPVLDMRSSRSVQRPASMYEPREGLLRSGSQSPHIHHCISATAHTGKWDKNQVQQYLSYGFLAFLCQKCCWKVSRTSQSVSQFSSKPL